MNTREIDALLDVACHKAAGLAAYDVRRQLRPFNLKRHPLSIRSDELMLGQQAWYEFIQLDKPVVQAIHEAGKYVEDLPAEVIKRLKDHL